MALSRAIGDFDYKTNANFPPEEQVVTAYPDITEFALTEDVLFCVMACDGIWDCMSNQEVVDFVQIRIAEGKELAVVCEEMMDWCLAPDAYIGAVGMFDSHIINLCSIGMGCIRHSIIAITLKSHLKVSAFLVRTIFNPNRLR